MLTRDQVSERLNLSPQSIEILVSDRLIIELKATDGRLYPSEQFSGSGINAKLASFLGFFRRFDLNGDTVWSWINSPLDALEGRTPLEELRLSESDESLNRLRFVAAAHWAIESAVNPGIERTDWLRSAPRSDENGIGDYTPNRRGGQHAS